MAEEHVRRTVTASFSLATRGVEGEVSPTVLQGSPGDDMIELDLGDGLVLYTGSGRDLSDQVDFDAGTRDGIISMRLRAATPLTRGSGAGLVIKGLKVLGVDVEAWLGISSLKDYAADVIAKMVADKADNRAIEGRGEPGVYRCDANTPYAGGTPSKVARTDKPMLVLLHGFFSSASGAFGGLWQPGAEAFKDTLLKNYAGALYGFDHRTLGESPITNAIALVDALPDGAVLHLLSHSRGGLIGELLSRAQYDQHAFLPAELDRFRQQQPSQADALAQLIKLMAGKQIRVERFVRVASPVRGTWLASDRLDRWLSIFYNLARFAIPSGAQSIADGVFDVLAAVVKKRLNPIDFPGIEAMCPQSPLITLLNDTSAELQQRLTVIAGDCVGSGILNRLKLLITDGFFGEPHDLVVPTASMFGGASRNGGTRYFFHQTPRVDHFHYFLNDDSLQRVETGLLGSEAQYTSMQLLDHPDAHPTLVANRAPPAPDAPLVVVLPGIMGSELCVQKDDKIWVDLGDLTCGDFARLRLDAGNQQAPYPAHGGAAVYPGGPLQSFGMNFYGDLLEALVKRGYAVLPAGYDWRKPLAVAADELATQIAAAWPEDSPRPLRLIGHSMGGLVARMLFKRHARLRERFVSSQANRLLMLGTPNGGSLAIARTLLGDNSLVDKLAFIAPQNQTAILSIANTFPGFHELLPQQGRNWSDPQVWSALFDLRKVPANHRPVFDPGALALGAQGREALRDALPALPAAQTYYVAGFVDPGSRDATITDIDASGAYVRGPGDGTVSYVLGLLPGVPTWYANAEHGDLPKTKSAFAAYFELLDKGDTALLPHDWKGYADTRRGMVLTTLEPRGDEPALAAMYRPTRGEVLRALLGANPRPMEGIQPTQGQPIALRMVNGSLRFARYPLIAGHYQGDTMQGSERDLDRLFDGQLRKALDFGVYPGDVEEFHVFKRLQGDADRRSPFAIVVGLGRPGELSAGMLRRTVRRGLLGWFGTAGSAVAQGQPRGQFSILLLGSTVSGMTVAECARAMLQGAQDAQAVLLARPQPAASDMADLITELELVEIQEDKALELAGELPQLLRGDEFRNDFRLLPALEVRSDAQRRLRDEARSVAGIRRLDIAADGCRLTYTLPGIQAAVPVMTRDVDIEEIRVYTRSVTRELQTDRVFGRVLFNQLLPLELKRFALEQYPLVLSLDAEAASFPWELADAGTKTPLAVQSGMIRQLQSTQYAARERVSAHRALVIGAPRVEGLPVLTSAIAEAKIVNDVLASAGFEVTLLLEPLVADVRDALGKGPYKVIHFAGHGLVDYELAPGDGLGKRTGMVIGSLPIAADTPNVLMASEERSRPGPPVRYRWLLLTSDDIREGLAQAPEAVFINCCHLGAQSGTPSDTPAMARNFANSFMNIGSRAVVAAGWAIEDVAARLFAERFYDAMAVRGATYMDAVREARYETYTGSAEGTPTWGAYQCYGDPGYSLVRTPRSAQVPAFNIPREAEYWLRAQVTAAMENDPATIESLRGLLLQALSGRASAFLGDEGTFLAALEACESIGVFGSAVDLLDDRRRQRYSMPLEARIVDARVRLRLAMLPQQEAAEPPARPKERLDAFARLEKMAALEGTAFAWFTVATLRRRCFLLASGPTEQRAELDNLVKATRYAWAATVDGLLQHGNPAADDAITGEDAQKTLAGIIIDRCLAAASVRTLARGGATLPDHDDMIRRCQAQLDSRRAAIEFWDDVDSADLQLLILASPFTTSSGTGVLTRTQADYDAAAAAIAEGYLTAIANSATLGQQDSIEAYIRFWYGAAAYFQVSGAAGTRSHWALLRSAMGRSRLPGIEKEPPPVAPQRVRKARSRTRH